MSFQNSKELVYSSFNDKDTLSAWTENDHQNSQAHSKLSLKKKSDSQRVK